MPVPAADSLQGLGADDAADACTPVSDNSSTITTPYEECTDGTRVVLESEYEPDQEVVEGLTANGGIEVDAEGSLTPYLRPASPGGDERRRVAEEEAALMADAAPSASVPQEVANIEARIASDDDVTYIAEPDMPATLASNALFEMVLSAELARKSTPPSLSAVFAENAARSIVAREIDSNKKTPPE